MDTPSEAIARSIAEDIGKGKVLHITRFLTGNEHYVYDVTTDSEAFVIRLTKPHKQGIFESALYWYARLIPLEIPLPTIRLHDIKGEKYGFPIIIMDRAPGKDLRDVYPQLSTDEKEALAKEMVHIQKKVAALPPAQGFGYAHSYEDPALHHSWSGVTNMYINRIKTRNEKTKIINYEYINRLEDLFKKYADYLNTVKPTPFLDDTTTKNVIIQNGKLSGIVDVDYVCFGDPLLVLALTHMSLIGLRVDTTYTACWEKLLTLTDEQKAMLHLYSGMYALEFASAMGQTFNKAEPERIDKKDLEHLTTSFEQLTSNL